MLRRLEVGPYTVRGLSLGGVYTTVQVPELDSVFDCGLAPRSFAATKRLFLSHGHADHIGGLVALLGARALSGSKVPLKLYLPKDIESDVSQMLEAASRLQRFPWELELVPMEAGQTRHLGGDLYVGAHRCFHPVPCLAYVIRRRVSKLRDEFKHLPGPEIADRRKAGDEILRTEDRPLCGYATDTLVSVLDHAPELYQAEVLILECTFLDQRKSLETARAGCHIHIDELAERASEFANSHIVLMHVSQIYRPDEVSELVQARLPTLADRIVNLVPKGRHWPG